MSEIRTTFPGGLHCIRYDSSPVHFPPWWPGYFLRFSMNCNPIYNHSTSTGNDYSWASSRISYGSGSRIWRSMTCPQRIHPTIHSSNRWKQVPRLTRLSTPFAIFFLNRTTNGGSFRQIGIGKQSELKSTLPFSDSRMTSRSRSKQTIERLYTFDHVHELAWGTLAKTPKISVRFSMHLNRDCTEKSYRRDLFSLKITLETQGSHPKRNLKQIYRRC